MSGSPPLPQIQGCRVKCLTINMKKNPTTGNIRPIWHHWTLHSVHHSVWMGIIIVTKHYGEINDCGPLAFSWMLLCMLDMCLLSSRPLVAEIFGSALDGRESRANTAMPAFTATSITVTNCLIFPPDQTTTAAGWRILEDPSVVEEDSGWMYGELAMFTQTPSTALVFHLVIIGSLTDIIIIFSHH